MHLHYLEKKYGIRINLLEWSGDDYETGTLNALIKIESTTAESCWKALRITYGITLETSCMVSWRFALMRKAIVTAPRPLRPLRKRAE
jgi:hypothetical protein